MQKVRKNKNAKLSLKLAQTKTQTVVELGQRYGCFEGQKKPPPVGSGPMLVIRPAPFETLYYL